MENLIKYLLDAQALNTTDCWVGPPKLVRDERSRAPTTMLPLTRWLYTILVGPIPDNRVIERFCTDPRCRNPHHYRVSKRLNAAHLRATKHRRHMNKGWATSSMGMIEGAIEFLKSENPEVTPDGPSIIACLQGMGVHVTVEDVTTYFREYPTE